MVHNMTTIQIKHRYTNAVLFECEVPDDIESGLHMRHALEKAVSIGASLDGASLVGASLVGASLRNASLDGALLDGASLDGALLYGASLRNASLRNASLDGASLRNASLDGASLRNASLDGALLDGASLDGALLYGGSKLSGNRPFFSIGPIGSRSDVFQAFTTEDGIRLKAGCFFGTLVEFRAKLIDTHGINPHREEYEAALLLIEKHAALWPADKTKE